MKLWLVRHAQVALPEGRCYGASDVPVQPGASRLAAAQLVRQWPAGLTIWHSPLSRCELLAHALQAFEPDFMLKPDPRLRELDFGAWEGQAWSDIGRQAIDAWLADFAHARPGGHGESVAALMQRVAAAFDDWRAGGRDAVWVTHAGVIRAALLIARGQRSLQRADEWPAASIAFGGVQAIEV